MEERRQRRVNARRRLGITLVVSLLLHLIVGILGLSAWLASRGEGISIGEPDYLLVTTEPPRKAPSPSPNPTPVKQQVRSPQPTRTAPEKRRSRTPDPTEEPAELPADDSGDDPEPASEQEAVVVDTGGGHPEGLEGEGYPSVGFGAAGGSVAPRPECLDQLDNDGDGLIDSEDPSCLINETPQERAEVVSRALLLRDLRQNKLPEGDPDELMRERIQDNLQDDGEGGFVYRSGEFQARIGPEGEIEFDRRRKLGTSGFNFGGGRRSRWRTREKLRFLEATAEVRDRMAGRAQQRRLRKAVMGLRADLEELWRDPRFNLNQKKNILFQRLDEVDRSSEEGRQAAKIIINFIREHSRPRHEGPLETPATPTGSDHPPPGRVETGALTPGRTDERARTEDAPDRPMGNAHSSKARRARPMVMPR